MESRDYRNEPRAKRQADDVRALGTHEVHPAQDLEAERQRAMLQIKRRCRR